MEIPTIKSRLSIATVLKSYGLKVDRNGMMCCPFHDDKTASMKIYPDTNTFHCFGCGKNGDGIEFIELKENCSKHDAIQKAKSLVDPNTPQSKIIPVKENEKELLSRVAVLSKLAQDSKAGFKRSPRAKAYLESRKLDTETLEVGYMGSDFGKKWNDKLQESGLQLGIFRGSKSSFVPRFKNCVLFFTKNEKGQIIDVYGRSMLDGTGPPNRSAGRHFYLNGKHQGIYPAYPKTETRKLIITESIIDAATLLGYKAIKNDYEVIALYGTNGFTDEIESAIKGLTHLDEIILFFDGDETGRVANQKYTTLFKKELPRIKVSVVDTPEGEDVNSLLQGHDADIFTHLLESRAAVETDYPKKQTTDQMQDESAASELDTSNAHKIIYKENGLEFIIWGGIEKDHIHRLKINLLVRLQSDSYHDYQDDVNLYSNGHLQRFVQGVSEELEVSESLLKKTIKSLKNKVESYRLSLVELERKALKPRSYLMDEKDRIKAESFLKNPDLIKNTMAAISKSGLVGEVQNGLLLFFLYLSRLSDDPLHAIIFGKSGSGKTYLQTKISECLPEESVRTITSLTENTLYYSAKDFWKHKVLMIEDLEGVYNAFLPLREFMSKQSISKLTTDKDAKGNNVQKVLVVEGPICVSGATTKENIYEDNANRSFLLHIDESNDHAKAVMDYQRKLQAGMINENTQTKYKKVLQNSQRLLKKVKVINPYATMLDIPESVFKKLRTNMHYLRLIEMITFYHQYQRPVKKDRQGHDYIETAPEDIYWANELIKDSLLRKSDELNGQLRSFFESLKSFASKKLEPKTIYAKEVREAFRMNPMRVNRYLRELENRGYIQRGGGNRKTGFEYEIRVWDEYDQLKSGINILDDILEKVRSKSEV